MGGRGKPGPQTFVALLVLEQLCGLALDVREYLVLAQVLLSIPARRHWRPVSPYPPPDWRYFPPVCSGTSRFFRLNFPVLSYLAATFLLLLLSAAGPPLTLPSSFILWRPTTADSVAGIL